jgi:hypothetical protein
VRCLQRETWMGSFSRLYLHILRSNNGLGTVYTFYIGYTQTETGFHGRWNRFLSFTLTSLRGQVDGPARFFLHSVASYQCIRFSKLRSSFLRAREGEGGVGSERCAIASRFCSAFVRRRLHCRARCSGCAGATWATGTGSVSCWRHHKE